MIVKLNYVDAGLENPVTPTPFSRAAIALRLLLGVFLESKGALDRPLFLKVSKIGDHEKVNLAYVAHFNDSSALRATDTWQSHGP